MLRDRMKFKAKRLHLTVFSINSMLIMMVLTNLQKRSLKTMLRTIILLISLTFQLTQGLSLMLRSFKNTFKICEEWLETRPSFKIMSVVKAIGKHLMRFSVKELDLKEERE